MAKRVVLYARVSTDGLSIENQLRELEAVPVKEGWKIVERFIDKGISGAKGREDRPAFDKLCKGIVQDLVVFLNEIHSKHANLYLHKQGIDTTTAGGKLLLQMLGVFAEFVLGRALVRAAAETRVVTLGKQGRGMRAIARELGIGNCTVQRIVGVA
ncbi:MAG: recombinase family protein [Nitrospirota bacterium]